MHKVVKYQVLKDMLKEIAENIKSQRNLARTEKSNGNGVKAHNIRLGIKGTSRDFRHYHIAYCELRGKTREQIEKPRTDNKPNEKSIAAIKEWVLKHETVCAD